MNLKILNTIGKKYTAEAKKILEQIGKLDCLDLNQIELENKINAYNILLVGLGLNINKQVIDRGSNLKIIATATTGLDHIDVEYAKSKKIKIISLRGENKFLNTITGTAELACGLMIDLMRNISASFNSVKNYEWNREKFRGHNLRGKVLGIVGLGRLGKMMARYGNTFEMKIIGYDPHVEKNDFKKANCKKVSFAELLNKSDIISIHAHLNKETENMFCEKTFGKIKNNAYLINTSRGKIVNEDDLLKALKKNRIAGYATDVLADELTFNRKFKDYPLVKYARNHNNVIILPHIGGMTDESRKATDIFIAKKIIKSCKEK